VTEKKIATPKIAKDVWDQLDRPSCRRVHEKLINAGYVTPSFKTISVWAKDAGWEKPKIKRPRKSRIMERLDDASPALTGDPRTKAEDIVNAVMKVAHAAQDEQPPPPPQNDQPSDTDAPPKADAPPPVDPLEEETRLFMQAIVGVDLDKIIEVEVLETFRAAAIFQFVAGRVATQMAVANPEGIAKMHLSAAQVAQIADAPLQGIGIRRELAMKNVAGTHTLHPHDGSADPLADVLNRFRVKPKANAA
jgi:hypothetical protein